MAQPARWRAGRRASRWKPSAFWIDLGSEGGLLDVTSWLLLDHIAELEGYANRDVLVSAVHERFHATDLPLTAMVRLFLQTYTAPSAVLKFLGEERRPYGRGFVASTLKN